ncbi:MAG: family 16 glycoside hydrolase [Methylococcales bacterium]
MPTSPTPQTTDFTRDVLGRYTCNGLDEALASIDPTRSASARPFDVVIVGGGSFGPIFAQHLMYRDPTGARRILVLEAGPLMLPEHVQNLPMLGLNVPGPTSVDSGVTRNEVWGLPWRTDVPRGFPGLAYCLGGRSVYFGGWSPQLLASELRADKWPASVIAELNGPLPGGSNGYFRQAAEQIGTTATNDFIFGPMHTALRTRLRQGIDNSQVTGAIPLAQLPLYLDGIPNAQRNLFKLEAPLAVQARPPRSGFFPFNKFSSMPILMEAARAAQFESGGDDARKRLMVVPDCHVTRLITDGSGPIRRIVAIETNRGTVPVPEEAAVVIALGTIESARLARLSLPGLPGVDRMGANLMAHLRSNLTIRLPRAAIIGVNPGVRELQASALFVKGRHTHADGLFGHFHLQITAAGLSRPSTDSEAELFKKIPDLDTIAAFREANDDQIVVTIRGIGEMRPDNPGSRVSLTGDLDEYGLPRAFVSISPAPEDQELWDAMDTSADDVALVFANGQPFEVLVGGIGGSFQPVPAGQLPSTVLPFSNRRDGLGTTHHEAGTLAMGTDPDTSVSNANARFHRVPNLYVAGPALFPTVGSPNPMLTGTALARRLGDHLAAPFTSEAGFTALFDGASLTGWQMSTIRNQPGRDDPGRFVVTNGALVAVPGTDIGLLWHTQPTQPDFLLKLEWRRWREDDNSGVFLRFPHLDSKGYDNTAFVAVDFGFEVQIDQRAAPDGLATHKTAAIYGFQGPADPSTIPVHPIGEWNAFEIRVQGQNYTVTLNGVQVTAFIFTAGSDALHPVRGLPGTNAVPRFIGLQTHTGRVAFRNIQIQAL